MSISRRKAGALVTCPQCVHRTLVPQLTTDQMDHPDEDASQTAVVSGPARSLEHSPDAWKQRANPWKVDEEEEEEEFQLSAPPLQESGLDMTPMVDVTFLLLIFFMITASFSLQKSLQTTPPANEEEGAAQQVILDEVEEASVVVSIDAENRISVDDEPIAGLGDLVDVLRSRIVNDGKTEMLIEADAAATHGTVVAVTDAGIEAQMQRIRRSSRGQTP